MLTRPGFLSRLHDDRGSLPLAMLAVVMVSALMGVVTANIIGGENQTRFDQDYENALQVADLGADRFFSMIKNGQVNTAPMINPVAPGPPPPAFCVGPNRPGVVDVRCLPLQAAPSGNATYQVRGEREATDEWTIISTAFVNGTKRTVRLRNVKQRPFQHALFGDKSVSFNGTPRQAYSYDSNTGAAVTDAATLGTNATSVNDPESTYKRPAVLLADMDVASDEAITFASDAIADCQAAGGSGVAANFTGPWTTPGTFCVQNLTFPDNGAPIVLGASVTQQTPIRIFVVGNVHVGRRAAVNCGASGSACVWPQVAGNLAKPGALQIYSVGEGQVTFGTEAKIAAAIFAPRSHCFSTPHANVFGAIVCRAIGEFTGHFRLFYDEALKTLPVAERRVWSEEPGA